ncbi:uncharacterized protein LOC132720570 isoform X2 [Ruditapes philippinarum]|uniref:uncharacterized protein LOC132720570 isoform X2 n=1 Tax=Ruditapes philippinarum TaxID=129788 RepID=UPI00295A572A|nr:uncharacterized protein LOC132720570 isoform X2 [Ruditapes philippinarum]
MSSYIYPSVKKRRKFCVCNKKNDGKTSKYRQCEGCSNWYHPDCIGVANAQKNYCSKDCEVVVINDDEQPNDEVVEQPKSDSEEEFHGHDRQNEKFINEVINDDEQPNDEIVEQPNSDSEEEFHGHDRQNEKFIPVNFINSQWENTILFLTEILSCDQEHCKKESHQRHHIFDENYANVIRRKHSYGVNYFKPKTIEQLCFRLQKHFLFQMLDPKYPATGLRIQMMRLSLNYSAYLLLNEALAFIVACYKNITYLEADEGCRETEVEIRDLIRKTRKNCV